MGLWGSNNGGQNGLMPGGIGGGLSNEQKQLFAQSANDSGLTSMGMDMANQMTGGNQMRNEDQLSAFYHLMAAHPNEVSLFFLHYPDFLPGIFEVMRLIMKQELHAFFSSDVVTSVKVDPAKAAELGYASITQENIDAAIAKAAPMEQMQAEVHQADMKAVNQMNGHAQGQFQQQQMLQQQQMQQQMMMQQQMPQRQGIGGAIGGFGSSLIRGTLGLPPAQQQQPMGMNPQMGYQQMPPQM
jgi:hypothetical protein